MKKRVSDLNWFPWWIDKWLFGSMRIECSLEQRAIWVDLVTLAAKDDGFIRANENVPYPIEQLAGMLIIEKNILESAIDFFVERGKLEKLPSNVLRIVTWEKYQFTDRYKREFKSVGSAKTEQASSKTEPILKDIILNDKILNKENIIKEKKVTFNFETEKFENIKEKDLQRWKETYPACNIEQELKFMADWLISNPSKKKSNYARFISNWLRKQQDQGGTKKGHASMSKKEQRIKETTRKFIERGEKVDK